MATPTDPAVTVVDPVLTDAPIVTAERTRIASPFGWSAIFAGATVTLAVWLVLHLIGVGIGLTAINPDDAGSLKGVGIGTGIWSIAAPIIALFVGGLVAGRVAPTINTGVAAIHGAVVWGLTLLGGFMLVMSLLGTAARGAGKAAGAVGDVAAQAVGAAGDVDLSDLGVSEQDLVGPINRKLAEQGKPAVTADQLKAVVKDVMGKSVRSGDIDRRQIVASIERNTALTGQDAQELASQLEGRVNAAKTKLSEAGEQAKHSALQFAEGTGKVLLLLSVATLLGLAAAIGGAIASVRHERREHVVLPRARID